MDEAFYDHLVDIFARFEPVVAAGLVRLALEAEFRCPGSFKTIVD